MSVATHARFVAQAKKMLLVLACILMIALVMWPVLNREEEQFTLTFSGVEKNNADKPSMINPRFQGIDENKHPYNILADKAIKEDKTHVTLSHVEADMVLANDGWISVVADMGNMDMDSRVVILTGNIDMFSHEGVEFRTEKMELHLKEGKAYGPVAIEGQGPMGTLKADSFEMDQKNKNLRFQGNVRMILYPDNLK